MSKFYDWLINIGSLDFGNKSALIIGGSEISKQYATSLSKLGVKDLVIIAKTGSYISDFCKDNKIELKTGGFEKNLPNMEKKDLVIIAPPIPSTLSAAELAIKNGQKNILIEKPGSLYYNELLSFTEKFDTKQVRVAYNRVVYPSFHKLKKLLNNEGGATSCRFTFTEWIDRIDFKKDASEVYDRWGISNSLHVISMALEIIGMPQEIKSYRYGKLNWHKSGSIFVGMGISEKNIPFSYHADWGSGGRWSIEIYTKENSYHLIPLEELYSCPKYSGKIESVSFKAAYPDIKPGIAEEVAIMLDDNSEHISQLVTLEKAAKYNQLAEKIFGYDSQK